MGLVKTRRLAAMRKQTTYAKATVVKQRAKFGKGAAAKEQTRDRPLRLNSARSTRSTRIII